MARRFINIKPVDASGEKPDRPSDEVLWSDLTNVWFDRGIMRKRPAYVAPVLYTAIAGGSTASPLHQIVQFYHPVAVEAENTERPNAAGDHTDWTAVPATNNYQRVDDVVTVDTDYVYATTSGSGHKDSYAFSNTSLTVLDKLTFHIRARRHTVGDYTITFFARTAGDVDKDIAGQGRNTTNEPVTTLTVPQATGTALEWEDYTFESDTDPHTSAAWTAANFNAYEFGYYATFSTVATVETIQPTADGNDTEWDLSTGSAYWDILADNAASGTPSSWTNYIYTDVNSESVSLTFGTTVNSFATITSIEPRVWVSTLGGSRELKLFVDDNSGTDAEYLVMPHVPVVSNGWINYDDYVLRPHQPKLLTWLNPDYTVDPANSDAWDPTTAFTYDWNFKTTAVESELKLASYKGPSSFTNATDWVMFHPSDSVTGSISSSDLAGTVYGRVRLDAGAGVYYADVSGTLSGTWAGTLGGDNLSITDTGETMAVAVEGRLTGSISGAVVTLTGTVSPISPSSRAARGASDNIVFDDSTGTVEALMEASGTISVTMTGSYGGRASAAITGGSATATPSEVNERIVDQTLWDVDWISQNPWLDSIDDAKKYTLLRDQYDQGSYPVDIPMTDIPSVNYKSINNVIWGMRARVHQDAGAPTLKLGLSDTMPDTMSFPADYHSTSEAVRARAKNAPATESEVNADIFEISASSTPNTTDSLEIYNINSITRFKAYPEIRVYKAELKITGTAGPQPAVSQFYITIDGATSTAKRTSKLLVSQTDFYRADGTTLTDILSAGSGTAPTGGRTQRWDTCKFFGKQYFVNNVDNIYSYPDASNEVVDLNGESPDTCRSLASFIGRLFAFATTESATYFPSRVRWTIVEDDSDWTGTGSGYIDLDDTDGEGVKLLPLGGILVAYKDTSLYNLHPTGDRDDAIVKQLVSPGIGCAALGTALSVVGKDGLPAHIFLGQGRGGYNVYMYTGNLLTPIGDDIKEELRDNLNQRQAHNAFAIVDQKRNQYMFFVAYKGETFPHRAWLYDIDTGQWKHWTVPEVTCAGHLEANEISTSRSFAGNVTPESTWTMFLGLGDSLSRWMDPDVNQDEDGTDLKMTAVSGDWAVEQRHKYATLYRLHIHYYDQGYTPLQVYTSTDGGDTYSDAVEVWIGQSDGSADNSLRVAYADLLATGKRFRVKIEHDADAAIKISEIQMEIEEQGWIV